MGAVLHIPRRNWPSPCEIEQGFGKLCTRCGWARGFVHKMRRSRCAQCGGSFLKREGYETGFSHCVDHKQAVK